MNARMTIYRSTKLNLGLLVVLGMLAAAGGAFTTVNAAGPVTADAVVMLKPVGDDLAFATTEVRAKAGSTLRIVFKNTSTMMPHSVVVLTSRADIEPVGMAALTAADHEYIPPDQRDKIIAYTAMAAPGETVEVTFTVPKAGVYPYICTYPGHFAVMQGTLIAE